MRLVLDPADVAEVGVLRDLGLERVELLSSNPDKQRALIDSGLTVSRRPLAVMPGPDNRRYLRTKATRLGHDMLADAG